MLLTQLFESLNKARLNVGDPVEITGNVEFKGTTGDVVDIGRNGAFVVVDLYNHGRQSFHSSDVSYNDYADQQAEEDDWYDDQEDTMEGWSDAMVARRTGGPRTPYSVYIKGKKWKDFENDDHAEAVANKLKAKFKADGRDPSVITIAPTDIPEAKATKTRLDPKCWTGKKIGNPKTKVKGGVRVNNCVPAESIEQGVTEAPIANTDDPMDPVIHGHEKANPMTLQGRIGQARNQLRDLARMADSNELATWEQITKLARGGMFMGLEQNLEQIRHGIEELAKKRTKGGVASRGISKDIGR
jgi:hypothetical protein